MAGRKATTDEVRFWEKVSREIPDNGGCWLWTAQLNNKGYGCFRFRGRPFFAHRASWILHYGQLEPGRNVLHHCDTPSCVRPDHLFVGCQKTNMGDCSEKGRISRGERHPCAKLTTEQVRFIRHDKRTQEEIAKHYGIHQITVSDIKRRKTWKHV